jgi:acetylornithine deacetylase/succinyl-diaminopimelate desuccinylase-like protein
MYKLTCMDATTLLAELVRRPSINPMGRTTIADTLTLEHRVTDYLADQLRSLGVPFRRQAVAPGRENLIAEFHTGSPITLLWEAHQDTVPVDGMTIDPFAATIADGKLSGRGACDVKAGIACMLMAFARLVREKPPTAANVILAFTVDEEHTFLGVQELVKELPPIAFAVVAEPTGLNIVTAHKGVVRWAIETTGTACHSSRPEHGVNAIYRMATLVTAIEQYALQLRRRPPHPLLGPPSLSVGMIHGGVSPNTVPDHCRIEIDRRLLPGEDAKSAMQDFELSLLAGPLPFRTQLHLACPALNPIANDHPILQRLCHTIGSVVGAREIQAVPYGTDASSIASVGIPAVVFGPGDIAQAHTPDEWIELAQLDHAAEILFRFAATAW